MKTQICKRCKKEKTIDKFYTKKFTGISKKPRIYKTGNKYYWKICKKCLDKNNHNKNRPKRRQKTGNVTSTPIYYRMIYTCY